MFNVCRVFDGQASLGRNLFRGRLDTMSLPQKPLAFYISIGSFYISIGSLLASRNIKISIIITQLMRQRAVIFSRFDLLEIISQMSIPKSTGLTRKNIPMK